MGTENYKIVYSYKENPINKNAGSNTIVSNAKISEKECDSIINYCKKILLDKTHSKYYKNYNGINTNEDTKYYAIKLMHDLINYCAYPNELKREPIVINKEIKDIYKNIKPKYYNSIKDVVYRIIEIEGYTALSKKDGSNYERKIKQQTYIIAAIVEFLKRLKKEKKTLFLQ